MIIYTAIAAIVFLLIAAAFLAADVSAGLLVSPLTWFFQLMNMAIDLRPPILPMALAASSVAWMSRLRAKGWLTVGPRCGDSALIFIDFFLLIWLMFAMSLIVASFRVVGFVDVCFG
jgi:hypothetical protein